MDISAVICIYCRNIDVRNAFSNSWIKEIVIPASVKELGEGAFSYCNFLMRADISHVVREIKSKLLLIVPLLRQFGSGITVKEFLKISF